MGSMESLSYIAIMDTADCQLPTADCPGGNMTLTVRTPAKLFHPETHAALASGVAVIWSDAREWGGIFEAQERAAELRAAVAGGPLTARLETLDGRRATITLAPPE